MAESLAQIKLETLVVSGRNCFGKILIWIRTIRNTISNGLFLMENCFSGCFFQRAYGSKPGYFRLLSNVFGEFQSGERKFSSFESSFFELAFRTGSPFKADCASERRNFGRFKFPLGMWVGFFIIDIKLFFVLFIQLNNSALLFWEPSWCVKPMK